MKSLVAKSLHEALRRGLFTGPLNEAEKNSLFEIRDYMAHRVMLLGDSASAMDLFRDIFKDIPAFRKADETTK